VPASLRIGALPQTLRHLLHVDCQLRSDHVEFVSAILDADKKDILQQWEHNHPSKELEHFPIVNEVDHVQWSHRWLRRSDLLLHRDVVLLDLGEEE